MDSLIPSLLTAACFVCLIAAIILDKKGSYSFTCLMMAFYTWIVRAILIHGLPADRIFIGTFDPRILILISVILLVFSVMMFLPSGKAQAIPPRKSGMPGWTMLLIGAAAQIGGFLTAAVFFYYPGHLGYKQEMPQLGVYSYLGFLLVSSLAFYFSSRLGTIVFPNFFRKTIHILQHLFFIPMTLTLSLCLIFAMPDFPHASYLFLAQTSLFGFLVHGLLLLAMRKNHIFVTTLGDEIREDFELSDFEEERFTLE